jgi:uncharacterized membrane protein
MTRLLIAYATTLIAFCCCDFVWLGWIAKDYYQSQLGALLLAQPNWAAAVIFYALYAAGIVFFCISPALEAGSLAKAALFGAVLGALAYATYDLTNQATLAVWQTRLTIIDLIWGTTLTMVSATGGYFAARWAEGRFG